jgi:hypothetical protein
MLRIRTRSPDLHQALKSELEEWFGTFMNRHPSKRSEPENETVSATWFPNNSLQYIDPDAGGYVVESYRYGGSSGFELAFQQFQHSSRAVLAVLSEQPDFSGEAALLTALQIHLCFFHALGLSSREVELMADRLQQFWSQKIKRDLDLFYTDPEHAEKHHGEMHASLQESWEREDRAWITYLGSIWGHLQQEGEFEQAWLNDWYREMVTWGRQWNAALIAGHLQINDRFQFDEGSGFPIERQHCWHILQDYLHPTNNRLGASYNQEWWISFILSRAMNVT